MDDEQTAMSDIAQTGRTAPAAGTGRLGVASAVFTVLGVASAIVSVSIARSVLTPPVALDSRLIAALAGALSLAFGCLRTSRLLDRRSREGVATAIIFLSAPLCAYFTGTAPRPGIVAAAVAGLVVVASVWRHLER
jgi:hypothetical protein